VVQSHLDLHGMNRDEARHHVALFLAECLQQGQRCVRIVHGKGLGSPGREPVLKKLVQGWLAQRKEVLAFCQARPADGGAGAVVLLLRAR
jgi:DNA-nicking Smr family endonuclease